MWFVQIVPVCRRWRALNAYFWRSFKKLDFTSPPFQYVNLTDNKLKYFLHHCVNANCLNIAQDVNQLTSKSIISIGEWSLYWWFLHIEGRMSEKRRVRVNHWGGTWFQNTRKMVAYGCGFGIVNPSLKQQRNKRIVRLLSGSGPWRIVQKFQNTLHFFRSQILQEPGGTALTMHRLAEKKSGFPCQLLSNSQVLLSRRYCNLLFLNNHS